MPNLRATFFKTKADRDLERSKVLLGLQYYNSTSPYYAGHYHAKAIIFPLAHSYHALKNLGRILEGVLLCVHALFDQPSTSLPVVLTGMLKEAGALILNLMNAMASMVTFITRSLASLFNLGYTETAVENFIDEITVVEVGGNNSLGMKSFLAVRAGVEKAEASDGYMTRKTLSL